MSDLPMDKITRALVEKVAPIIEEMESRHPEHIIGIRVIESALSEFEVQYGVVERINDDHPRLLPFRSTMQNEAIAYMAWIKARNIEICNKAIVEKAQLEKARRGEGQMPPSNENYIRWFERDPYSGESLAKRPLMAASYHIVKRYMSKWEEVR